jgi:hypothetical protein
LASFDEQRDKLEQVLARAAPSARVAQAPRGAQTASSDK